jgi:phosphohistidine phosphatase
MRRLMLLRHAKTERAAPGARDRDRKLEKRGRSDAPVIGAYMERQNLVPDLALVSCATRAQETWALVAACFAKAPRMVTDDRIYNADPDTLVGAMADAGAARALLLVGHNPGLHDLAMQLVVSGDALARGRLEEKLPTCGLVVIDLPLDDWIRMRPRTGRLQCFVSPRLIAEAMDQPPAQ